MATFCMQVISVRGGGSVYISAKKGVSVDAEAMDVGMSISMYQNLSTVSA